MNAPDSGGVDLGTLGQLGGSLPGLNAVTKTLSRGPEWSELASQHQQLRAKDFNDQPVGYLAGASNGTPTYGPPGGAGSSLAGAAEELGGLA